MSQMVTRQRTGGDEKEKRADSPVKDMKKKMAANAEKEKNAAESTPSKSEKPAEKPADKPTNKPSDKPADKPSNKPTDKTTNKPSDKPADKPTNKPSDKPADKPTNKPSDKPTNKPSDKPTDKPSDKSADKSADKPKADKPADKQKEKVPEKPAEKNKSAEKKDGPSEKKKEENGKAESSGKTEKPGKTPKQNGSSNGINGTSDLELVDEGDETELFPELAYDDSDVEWEPGQESSRSLTRRSQVKATRTPETPRPASDKAEGDESKESKVLKLSQEPAKDSPKPDKKSDKKSDAKKSDAKQDAAETPKRDAKKEVKESPKKDDKKDDKPEKVEFEIVVEIENSTDPSEGSRKPDTNFSKSRVKVSPYRRSGRLADLTASSVAANYTGNNTTMEMDITESSSLMEESLDDSYLRGLRSIRGRRSYKLLHEVPLRAAAANRSHSVRSVTTIVSEQSSRPTAPVVGRKRKPEPEDSISVASEAEELPQAGKRQRLLERLARPFRRTAGVPLMRNAEIVGINTDLPLTAPVASTSSFDPETLKAAPAAPMTPTAPMAPMTPVAAATPVAEDSKRCVIM